LYIGSHDNGSLNKGDRGFRGIDGTSGRVKVSGEGGKSSY
jgi:hypothetical protein